MRPFLMTGRWVQALWVQQKTPPFALGASELNSWTRWHCPQSSPDSYFVEEQLLSSLVLLTIVWSLSASSRA